MKPLFFALIFLALYSYAVYPLILALISKFAGRKLIATDNTPQVTLIISAFNEKDAIASKIENSLSLDYPKEKLEILVVSDCSTDGTDDIVRGYSRAGVELLSHQSRRGKTAGLNDAVQKAKGEILVFSDADSMYEPAAIRKIVAAISSSGVGLVTGSTIYKAESSDGKMVETSSAYTKLERLIKHYESRIGSCVGADGAIFGMRKALYKPLKNDDINDLVIPLNVVMQNYRVILHDDLFCVEEPSADSSKEFKRQIRITNRTLRAIFRHAELMNPFKYPFFSFALASHKLVRLSVPFYLLILIPLNIFLAPEGPVYILALTGQGIFYIAALIGYMQERSLIGGRTLTFVYHFVTINISILLGWVKFLRGDKQVTW